LTRHRDYENNATIEERRKMQQEEGEIYRKKIKEERRRNGHGEKINGKAR